MRTNAPGQSALLLLDIIPMLQKQDIPYAIIGAFAASFYGAIRASLDADAVISVQDDAKNALLSGLKESGLKTVYHQGDRDDPVKGSIHIEDGFYNCVDLLLGIQGMEEEIFDRVVVGKFMGSSIHIVGLEDFIAMKVFAGSPKDMNDVEGVLEVSGDKVKTSLLKELTLKYGKRELEKLEELLKGHNIN